jgi:hypothetical protein
MQLPIAGKIRTGIMVLTATGKQHPQAVQIYNDGVAKGLTFDVIGKQLREAFPNIQKSLLTPKNIPYFRVSRHDFDNPANADLIMEKYGEDRGDGRKLYRFPVVFAFDDWLKNLPHGLNCYTGNTLKYRSHYMPDGTRVCLMHEETKVHEKSKRAVRNFGGRHLVLRPENNGRCEPEKCPEYQCRACKLTGRVLSYIPDIPGSSLFEMKTTSFYSMDQMRSAMALVSQLRQGRISGTYNGKAIFWLRKVEDEVPMLDDEGKPVKVKQFLVRAETEMPMTDLLAQMESRARALAAPEARAALTGPDEVPTDAEVIEPEPTEGAAPEGTPPAGTQPTGNDLEKQRVLNMRSKIASLVKARGEKTEEFGVQMRKKHGDDAMTNPEKLSTILFDLETGQ